ncbi:MAG TPA: protein translocase subunit SecD, partial [Clostridiales bacterium]|nr:protein translocase subunit SecD [Clostridiales bacterium]
MKIKNAVLFLLIVALIAFGAIISVNGFSAGNIKIDPVKDKVKLGLDLKGGVFIVLEAQTDATGSELDKIMEQTKEVVQKRVDAMGLTEPNILREGRNRIRIELPGVENAQEAIQAVGKTAQLQFLTSDGKVVLTGKQVKNAEVVFDDQMGNQPMVSLSLNSDGAKAFQKATKEAASAPAGSPERIIAIVLDNEVISAPSVTEEIPNGQAVITGNFTLEEASQ